MNTTSTTRTALGALLVALLMILPGSAIAQIAEQAPLPEQRQIRSVTLDEAVGLLGANLSLRLARLEAAEAKSLARQSNAYPNPTITASYESLDQVGAGATESYLTLSQRLEWPGARSARLAAAREDAVAAQTRVAADSALLVFHVKRAYVQATRADRYADILERATIIFRQAVTSAGERYEEGDVSLYDVRRIEVERVRYEASLADARFEVSSARRALALLLAPETEDLQLAPASAPIGTPPPVDLDSLSWLALSRRPEIAAAEAQIRSAQAQASGFRAQRVPNLTATGGFTRQSNGRSGPFLGVSFPLPLWNHSNGAIEAADVRVAEEEAILALTRRQVENDASGTLEAYRSQVDQAGLFSDEGGPPTTDLLAIAQVAYDAGEMELIELLDAAEAFRDAESAVVRIQSDLWIRYYDLERAIGGFGNLTAVEDDQ